MARLGRARPARAFISKAPPAPLDLEPPQTVAGLHHWFDATKITGLSDGASVSQWNDASGNGRHLVQATGGNQPTYQTAEINSLPAVQFATDDFMATAAFAAAETQPTTYFFVARMSSTATDQNFIDGISFAGGNRQNVYFYSPNGGIGAYAGGTDHITGGGTLGTTDAFLCTVVFDGPSSILRVNGTQVATGTATTPGTNSQDGLRVGSDPGDVSDLNGYVAELICYSTAVAGADLTTVESYLTDKWLAAAGVSGAAQGQQRTSGEAAVRKQAAGAAQGANRSSGTATATKTAQGAAQGQQRLSGVDTTRKQWVAAVVGAQRSSGQDTTRKQAIGAASAPQRSSGAAVARKQAIGAAAGRQRTAGLAAFAPAGPSGAAQGALRTSGTATAGVKTAAGAAQHRQRTAAQTGYDYFDEYSDTYLTATGGVKGGVGGAAGRQRTSGITGSFKGGAAQGTLRTSGTAAGQHRGVGVGAGSQRTSGQAVVIHRGVGAAAGRQRTSGFSTAEPSGLAVGSQRTSGTATGVKAAARGTQGQARTAGAATGLHRGITTVSGAQRTSGVCVSRKTATSGSAVGAQRTSGAVVGIHRGVGVASGRQRTDGDATAIKAGRGVAVGQQRTSGICIFTTVPPPRWVEGDATSTGHIEGVLVGAGIVEGSGGI